MTPQSRFVADIHVFGSLNEYFFGRQSLKRAFNGVKYKENIIAIFGHFQVFDFLLEPLLVHWLVTNLT